MAVQPRSSARGILVQRALLLVVAVLAAGWLAGNYRASHLARDGAFLVGKGNLTEGGRDYVRARRFASDPHLLVEEGSGLLVTGHPDRALLLGLQATRKEPENIDAWALVFQASERSDPALAARARKRIVALDPRAGSPSR